MRIARSAGSGRVEAAVTLKALLEENRAAILERWIELVLGSYPTDTAVFLRKQRDRFANPVGHAIHSGLAALLDALISGENPESQRPKLDDVLRIRAVQQLGPARSLEFLFQLKDAVRAELGQVAAEPKIAEELLALERRVDALGLVGFEVYSRCRDQIFELRLTEIRNRSMDVKEKLLRQRGRWTGPPEDALLLFPDGTPGQAAPDVTQLETGGPGERGGPLGSGLPDPSGPETAPRDTASGPAGANTDKPTAE